LGEAVIVQSYERIEPSDSATSADAELRLGKALVDWGGPIGLALVVLWIAARFVQNSNRAAPQIADAESPIVTKLVSTDSRPVLEDHEHDRRLTRGVPRLNAAADGSDSPVSGIPAPVSILDMDGPIPSSAPFGFLHRLNPDRLVPLIVEEHPQTMALILSNLPAAVSAAVLARLPTDNQMDVMRRIATIKQASPEILSEVERGLEARLRSSVVPQHEQTGGIAALAQMLTTSAGPQNREILDNLEEESPELVAQIRRRMFHFEDLQQLDSRAFQELLKVIELVHWALALKGASTELQTRVLECLSWRDSNLLLEEIQYLGPVRVSDIEAAQRLIVDAVVQGATAADHSMAASNPNLLFM
jgi:flagellar motor switch protein FliG